MDGAATRGRLDLVQGLAASRSEGCSAEAFVGAAANGHSAVLEWLIGHYPELYDPPRCFVAAAESGQADIVNLTRQQRWNPHVLRDVIGPAVEAAAANGRVHVLEALRPWPPNQTKAFMAAAAHGHTDVMEMFNCVDSTSRLSSAAVLRDVTECGDPAAIEWLIQRYDPSERAIDQMLRTAVWATVVELILRSCEVGEGRVFSACMKRRETAATMSLSSCSTMPFAHTSATRAFGSPSLWLLATRLHVATLKEQNGAQ